MKLVIIGYGGTGTRIADLFKKFERKYHNHITSYVLGVDSATESLSQLKNIDESHQLIIGRSRLEGRGSGGDLDTATHVVKRSAANVLSAVKNNISRYETDAFLVIGSLGGATGGAGAAVTARDLAYRYDDIPVYTAGVLPSMNEPATYTSNAAKTIQSVSGYSDNTILFDNNYLGAVLPRYDDSIDDSTTHYDAFRDVNSDIARALYLVFSADETNARGDLSESTISTNAITDTLSTGGISTIGYAQQKLPMAARPGIFGWLTETASYMKHMFSANEDTTSDEEIEDATEPENDSKDEPQRRDWPHPTDFVPETLHPDSLMLDADPRHTGRGLHLLIGPKRYLTPDNPEHVMSWVHENTNAERTYAGNYPVGTSRVGTLALYSDIGIPKRLDQLQNIAEKAEEHFKKQRENNPRARNVFDETDSTAVSPVIE